MSLDTAKNLYRCCKLSLVASTRQFYMLMEGIYVSSMGFILNKLCIHGTVLDHRPNATLVPTNQAEVRKIVSKYRGIGTGKELQLPYAS